MRISTLGYVGKQGVKNIWRNKMFSLASIATMGVIVSDEQKGGYIDED